MRAVVIRNNIKVVEVTEVQVVLKNQIEKQIEQLDTRIANMTAKRAILQAELDQLKAI